MFRLIIGIALACLTTGCGGRSDGDAVAPTVNGSDPIEHRALAVTRVALPGEGRGDYITVDGVARRLYVTHTRVVHILDLDSLRPLAQVNDLQIAHGVAIAGGYGFATDGGRNAVVEFDLASGRVLRVIPAGKKPDSIVADTASGKVFAFNNESADVTVIDPATGAVVKTISLPAGPEFSQSDGKGRIWANTGSDTIAVIDARTMTLAGAIPLPGCKGPTALGFDAGNRLLFSGCDIGVMAVTDVDAGKVIATVQIGRGGDPDGIAYDAERRRVVVANRNGRWTIIRQNARADYTVEQQLPMDAYAKTVAIDAKTHRLFSSTADLVWPSATPGRKHLPDAKPGTFRLVVVAEH